jgi:hypothetical protein
MKMSDDLEKMGARGVNPKYLKYDLYAGKNNNPREAKLDQIALAIGKTSYRSFVEILEAEQDPVLQSMAGEYYCYVRMNLTAGKVLRSPVKISTAKGQLSYLLKGGRLNYSGDLKKVEGCLFVLMRSGDGTKSFYHIYRIGTMPKPKVLQGIFSGVSTDFNPIGGRALLFRTRESFESLRAKKIDLQTLKKSKRPEERRIAEYFANKQENNITIKRPYTFSAEDL